MDDAGVGAARDSKGKALTSPRPSQAKERLQSRAVGRLNDAIKSIFADAVVLRPSNPFSFVASQLRELDQLTRLSRQPSERFALRQVSSKSTGGNNKAGSRIPKRVPARPNATAPAHTRPSRHVATRSSQ